MLGVLGQTTLNFVAVATLLFFFFCECPKFCDLAKQRRKNFWGVSEVGKIDFALYLFWLCVFFLVFFFFCCDRATNLVQIFGCRTKTSLPCRPIQVYPGCIIGGSLLAMCSCPLFLLHNLEAPKWGTFGGGFQPAFRAWVCVRCNEFCPCFCPKRKFTSWK